MNVSRKNVAFVLTHYWRPLIVGAVGLLLLVFMLFHSLGWRPAALSAPEVTTRSAAKSLHTIWQQPVNAPLTLPEHFLIHSFPHSVLAARFISAIIGLTAVLLFFAILRFWYGNRLAVVGTALFATSSTFLHVARLNAPTVLLFGPLLLVATGLWLKHSHRRNLALLICAPLVAISLYIPGLIWFVLLGCIWQWRSLTHETERTKVWIKVLAGLLFASFLAPLVWALVGQPSLAWTVAGLPQHFSAPLHILKNLGQIPLDLFWHHSLDPIFWLANSPTLNLFEDAMLVLGTYTLWQHRHLGRAQFLIGASLVSVILIALGGPVTLTILVPWLYVLITAGIVYLLDEWFGVFPYNPVARTTGIVILLVTVAISCNYQLQRYFVAWQNAPATRQAFIIKPSNLLQ